MNFGNNLGPVEQEDNSHIIGASFSNSVPASNFTDTVPPIKVETLGDLEKRILAAGEIANLELDLIKRRTSRNSLIRGYSLPAIINFNTKIINESKNLEDLILKVKKDKINLVSRDNVSGEFKVYAQDYLLEELNFINKYLGFNVSDIDKQDIKNIELAKIKAKGLTRVCDLRYKVREILTGVK